MKDRFLSGKGKVVSQTRHLTSVNYRLVVREGEPIQGRLQVLSGADGLSLYECEENLILQLDDGRNLAIIIQTPIDITNDSWHILGSGPIQ